MSMKYLRSVMAYLRLLSKSGEELCMNYGDFMQFIHHHIRYHHLAAAAGMGKDGALGAPLKSIEEKVSFSRLKKINNDTLHSEAIKIAWKSVRDIVALRLMGDRGCAVPHLHEATKYGLLNVLVKEKKRLTDKLIGKPATIHWSAPLETIIPENIKLENFRASNKVELIDQDSRELMQYHLKNSDDKGNKKEGRDAEKKQCDIELKLYDVQHYKINSENQETPVALQKHFQGVDTIERIYLITEVYVAKSVIMNVKVNENKYQWNSTSMMPIGFIFRKCDMTLGGILKYGVEVERKKAIEYNWVTSEDENSKVKSTSGKKS